ncbi:hypothetical protein [Bradyrhizobium sp. AZCC 2262]|uniref:hypothetical protein n=1 Tax=Bradyrhizobium sp. AZCC 2262 TaxID=3117022 RepID=UPI002FEF6EFD
MLQKIRDRLMDASRAEPVIVFEKQINIILNLGQIVDQARQDRCRVDQVVLQDQPNCAGADVRTGMVQGLGYVTQKPRGFVVVRIDGQPSNTVAVLLELLGASRRQRSLAEACRRLDDGKPFGREFGQDRSESGTCDQPAESRRQNLGREEWQLSPGGRGGRSGSKIARSRLDQGLPLSP